MGKSRPRQNQLATYCDQCGGKRKHRVLKELKETWYPPEEDADIAFVDSQWQILRCQGCEHVRFREYVLTSEDCLPGDDNPQGQESLYPTPQRRKPKTFRKLPEEIQDLYEQTVRAFAEGMPHLCAAGLRTIVEMICQERGIEGGIVLDEESLQPKLQKGRPRHSKRLDGRIWGLAERGIITLEEAKMLHKHRYLGNDALHDGLPPPAESLETAMDIIENILEKIYELPHKARRIKRARAQANEEP